MRGLVLTAVLCVGCWTGLHAQMGEPAPAAGAKVEPAKALDALLSSFEKEVVAAAQAMPADKYSFTPDSLHIPGAKFEGVRTFAGEVTHIAQANYFIASGITGTKPTADMKALAAITGKDQAVKALKDSFLVAHQAIATVTVANQDDAMHGDMNKAVLAAYIPVHGFDHYGQMVEYLRMNGIVPPASAK